MIKELVGQRIKQLRQKLDLSQEKFALSINMDRTYLASVEAGKRNVSIVNLEKIVNGLQVSFENFFRAIKRL
ncbi:putative transcriptional regulators [Candidatus Termititenax aidoneus]|uniref:Transcriptional regulators n=1 Tax=Termititenax aidoneus TaxID=2218524 RepID=A0A388T784_TERA1|nr:putative transcriptional regulators [Candidatus Termititenax aidoneus]